jgi:hypothetical protein
MQHVKLKIIYCSDEDQDYNDETYDEEIVKYVITKEFFFTDIPQLECQIILRDDAIDSFHFHNVIYDPHDSTYYVTNVRHDNVERYYSGDAKKLMSPLIKKYKKCEWSVKLVKRK